MKDSPTWLKHLERMNRRCIICGKLLPFQGGKAKYCGSLACESKRVWNYKHKFDK